MLKLPAPLLPTRASTVSPVALAPLKPQSRPASTLSSLPAVSSLFQKVVPQPLLQALLRLAASVTAKPLCGPPTPKLMPTDAALLVRLVLSVSRPTAAVSVMSRSARRARFWLAMMRLPTRLMSPRSVPPVPPVAVRLTLRRCVRR